MADGELLEVSAGRLKDVPVKAQAGFFGGSCDASLGGTQKDDVMLRAVSLILLKSLEVNMQRSPGNTEADCSRTRSGMEQEQVQTEHASDCLLGNSFVRVQTACSAPNTPCGTESLPVLCLIRLSEPLISPSHCCSISCTMQMR